ncbi:hypothetical protein EBZ39_00010 [bacterium]|nr:hypothetical protein [bacterium]
MYTPKQHHEDKERILQALDALVELREEYKDVIAIPEVVTLHDITEYRVALNNTRIKPFKEVFDRIDAESVLNYFNGTDYITPESFENTVVYALQKRGQLKK